MSEMVQTLRPMLGAVKPRQRAPKSITIRLRSSELVHSPGIVVWLQHMARIPSQRPTAIKMLRATYPGLPAWAYPRIVDALCTTEPDATDGEAVIIRVTR